jgi:hypothetical protein
MNRLDDEGNVIEPYVSPASEEAEDDEDEVDADRQGEQNSLAAEPDSPPGR